MKVLLYSTRNQIQYPVINHSEKEYMCVCVIKKILRTLIKQVPRAQPDLQVLGKLCRVLTQSVLWVSGITLLAVYRMALEGPGPEGCHRVTHR